jgi:putative sterol carrier protein
VEKFAFLSDEWTEEVRRLHDAVVTQPTTTTQSVRMNLILTDSPLGDSTIDAHLDTSSGDLVVDTGHLESAELTVTVDYETAKAILVDGDTQAALQAFLSGRIKVDGDIAQLLSLQNTPIDPAHQELARRIREITV